MAGHHLGPLHGIPVAVKDLYATSGVATTYGSPLFADWVPDFDAAAVERLKRAGAVLLGKTNLHELAYGTTSANAHYGPVHNPWRQGHHPGGSSGGSAAAVAAGMACAALGSDTGASIRQPAACCGIVGIKPTFGRVSKYGALPLSWSQDHVGPLTRTRARRGADAAGAGRPRPARSDHACSARCPTSRPASTTASRGRRIGVARAFFFEELRARGGGRGRGGARGARGPGRAGRGDRAARHGGRVHGRHAHDRGRGCCLPRRRPARAARDVQRRAARGASSSAASTRRSTTSRRSACAAS